MKKIIIIGATGSLGAVVRSEILAKTDYASTLFARDITRLGKIDGNREHAVSGNATNLTSLEKAISGQDVVFVSLSGDLPTYVKNIIAAMKKVGAKKLIFIASMGIYNELPGNNGNTEKYPLVLAPYRKSADLVENSGLEYTIIRPGWFDHSENLKYQLTHKGEVFIGHDISRKAIADLVIRVIEDPSIGKDESLGIAR